MRIILSATSSLVLLLCSCQRPLETEANHIVHSGEQARILHSPRNPVCIAVAKADAHIVAQAVDRGDEPVLKQLLQSGRAIETDPATEVIVQYESFGERGIRLQSGPRKGQQGWVPFEWLTLDR